MPVENEIKFILDPMILYDISFDYYYLNIEQHYLSIDEKNNCSTRIRKTVTNYPNNRVVFDKHVLTYKIFIENILYEFDKLISEEEYLILEKKSFNSIYKNRITFDNEIDYWVIDVFYKNYEPYFYLAEVEMPENETTPSYIPKIIEKHILKQVTDNSCSNTKLHNVEYAKGLLNACKQETLGV